MKEIIIKCDRCGNITKAQHMVSKKGYGVCKIYKDSNEVLDLCDQCLDSLDVWMAKSVWLSEEVVIDDGK